MKEKYLQIGTAIYIMSDIHEWWWALIYDYSDASKDNPHRVAADSWDRAEDILERSYKEYKDKESVLGRVEFDLKNIITDEKITKHFKTKEECDEFIKKYSELSFEAQKIISSENQSEKLNELSTISRKLNSVSNSIDNLGYRRSRPNLDNW